MDGKLHSAQGIKQKISRVCFPIPGGCQSSIYGNSGEFRTLEAADRWGFVAGRRDFRSTPATKRKPRLTSFLPRRSPFVSTLEYQGLTKWGVYTNFSVGVARIPGCFLISRGPEAFRVKFLGNDDRMASQRSFRKLFNRFCDRHLRVGVPRRVKKSISPDFGGIVNTPCTFRIESSP